MAWNVGVIAVESLDLENIIPDILRKTKVEQNFEEASSSQMTEKISVTQYKDFTIIIDVDTRFMKDKSYVSKLANLGETHAFYVSENVNYSLHKLNFFGTYKQKIMFNTIEGGLSYLKKNKLPIIDEFGETVMLEVIEYIIFDNKEFKGMTSLFNMKYDLYELDF